MGVFSLVLVIGLILGVVMMGIGFYWMINREKAGKLSFKFLNQRLLIVAIVALGAFAIAFHPSLVILAQDATPVPLVIPLSDIFTQANNWLQTLSPIESLAIGITIALAVFGFLYKAIKSAFG